MNYACISQESYHGKGPHDGVGATCKHAVWKSILQGRHIVLGAEDFFNVAKMAVSGICSFFLSEAAMNEKAAHFERKFINCVRAGGIQSSRCIIPRGLYVIDLYSESKQ